MPEARLTPAAAKPASANIDDLLADPDEMRKLLKQRKAITSTRDQPVIHTTYAVGVPPDMGDGHPSNGKECVIIAIPCDQAFGDLRLNPRRWDENQGKWVKASIGVTISATLAKGDTPVTMRFRDTDGDVIGFDMKQGLTLNLGLVGKPKDVD